MCTYNNRRHIFDEEELSYSAIEDVAPHMQARYASDDRQPLEVSNVKGSVYENATLDFSIFEFGDGEGHRYCPMDVNSGRHPNGSSSTTPR